MSVCKLIFNINFLHFIANTSFYLLWNSAQFDEAGYRICTKQEKNPPIFLPPYLFLHVSLEMHFSFNNEDCYSNPETKRRQAIRRSHPIVRTTVLLRRSPPPREGPFRYSVSPENFEVVHFLEEIGGGKEGSLGGKFGVCTLLKLLKNEKGPSRPPKVCP